MKKIVYSLVILAALATSSCRKDEPERPSFEVKVGKSEFNVNDTVTFDLKGSADIISFYSGETGKEYRYKDRIDAEGLKLQLTLGTRVLYGMQTNNLSLLCSSTFGGMYSPSGIKEEEWTDITSKFTLSATPAGQATTTTTLSGPVDLSEYVVKDKPIYFAFKYKSDASATTAAGGRTWRIYNFDLETVSGTGTKSTVTTARTGGWIAIDIENAANKWVIATTAPFLYLAPGNTSPSLDWVISSPFQPTSVNPDKGVPIKALLDQMGSSYKHVFRAPGNYRVTFLAKNVNGHGEKEVIKELDIVVK
ncbi:MAG: DUF5017 domain-containing protein [Pedobacter sp.]|nr:MAG: DUF5017 domain-containing protein [Pedobacter sp.]